MGTFFKRKYIPEEPIIIPKIIPITKIRPLNSFEFVTAYVKLFNVRDLKIEFPLKEVRIL